MKVLFLGPFRFFHPPASALWARLLCGLRELRRWSDVQLLHTQIFNQPPNFYHPRISVVIYWLLRISWFVFHQYLPLQTFILWFCLCLLNLPSSIPKTSWSLLCSALSSSIFLVIVDLYSFLFLYYHLRDAFRKEKINVFFYCMLFSNLTALLNNCLLKSKILLRNDLVTNNK